MKKIIVSWVGSADLNAAGTDTAAGSGPIAQAVDSFPFDQIHLLNNFPKVKSSPYLWVDDTRITNYTYNYCLYSGGRFMALTARKLNFMIDNEIADELEKLVPSGQRSRLVSQAIANELALQRRRSITSKLMELQGLMPRISAEKLQSDLADDRNRR